MQGVLFNESFQRLDDISGTDLYGKKILFQLLPVLVTGHRVHLVITVYLQAVCKELGHCFLLVNLE